MLNRGIKNVGRHGGKGSRREPRKSCSYQLKGGKVIRGSLHGFDQHMNLLLEDSVEILEESKSNDLGTIVVRGDNVVIISPPPQ